MGRSNNLVIHKVVDLLKLKDVTSRAQVCAFLSEVFSFFKNHGYKSMFVGGCVRDYLLNIPIKDIDIATNMPVKLMFEKAREAGFLVIPTGIDFGTVTFIFEHLEIQITTLREDVKTDGRKAIVRFTDSFEKDSARRDFSFNALYMDEHGNILDFHNGISDLKNHRIKFIGNTTSRIKEDFLRIFRYFRFWGKYASSYKDQTVLNTIFSLSDGIKILSGERIFQEILRVLELDNAHIVINTMMPMLEQQFKFAKNTLPGKFKREISSKEKFTILACGIIEKNNFLHFLNRLKIPNAIKKQCIILHGISYSDSDNLQENYLKHNKETRLFILNMLKEFYSEKYSPLYKLELNISYEFDITGKDVIAVDNNIDKTKISNLLKECRMFWIHKLGIVSRTDCITFLANRIFVS